MFLSRVGMVELRADMLYCCRISIRLSVLLSVRHTHVLCSCVSTYQTIDVVNILRTVRQPQQKDQGRIHGLKSGERIMASARNEAPRELGVGRVSPSPPERGLGKGLCPSQEFFSIFELKMACFGHSGS